MGARWRDPNAWSVVRSVATLSKAEEPPSQGASAVKVDGMSHRRFQVTDKFFGKFGVFTRR